MTPYTLRRTAAALLAAPALILAAACSPATPVTGVIVGKDYDRGSCTTTYITKKVGESKVRTPSTKCKSDEYELDVRTDEGKVREVDVDPYTFQQVNVGDRWPKGASK